jgi:thiol-disulfide isomerase/thioredoxin
MISTDQSRSKIRIRIIFAGLLLCGAVISYYTWSRQIVLKVVGPDGKALADAKVYEDYSMQDGQRWGKVYTCDGNGLVHLPKGEVFQYKWQREQGVVLYGLYEDKLAGFVVVKASNLGKKIELKLTPACRVHGRIKSTELTNLGQKVEWTNVYVTYVCDPWLYNQSSSCSSRHGMFKFLLPNGKYKLDAYGTRLYHKQEEVEVKVEQKELKINFDLPADRLGHLIGNQAPELQQIKGWINSEPIKLADLRGKVVLLDFWFTSCGSCVAAMPHLIDLYEKYHDKGLVIIGIHDDSMNSVKELEEKIEQLSKDRWKDRKIPFPVALDGGGECKIEGTQLSTSGATTAAYGINGFPTMVLIDKEGRVVEEYEYHADVLEKLLAADVDNKP